MLYTALSRAKDPTKLHIYFDKNNKNDLYTIDEHGNYVIYNPVIKDLL